ncbi:MBL fold metallo-hydrolase [Paenibacillus sp. GCM10012306]|uniref:MBL fold metallo-hydrolase n=1 Tax=Paenibacillus sp. GCM10012306 TaxID=3317342 RepID=UPI00360F4AD6
MTTLTIWGGAGEHGRSSYLIRNDQAGILLDCGVKKEAGSEYPLLEVEKIPELQAVFLSHAHEDHSAALPLLYKYGYKGKVWTTRETALQLPDYFTAWRNYVTAGPTPLPFEEADCAAIEYAYLEEHTAPLTWLSLTPNLRVMWGRSGHMTGSIWVALEWDGKIIFFSGDFTGESQLLGVDEPGLGLFPAAVQKSEENSAEKTVGEKSEEIVKATPKTATEEITKKTNVGINVEIDEETLGEAGAMTLTVEKMSQCSIDLAIIDAAYGVDPETQSDKLLQLASAIRSTLEIDGTVLLPVPLYGRGQELLVWVAEQFPDTTLIAEERLLTPLRELEQSSFWLRETAASRIQALLNSDKLHIVSDSDQRRQAMAQSNGTGAIIFTEDGMLISSTARWYYDQLSTSRSSQVIFTGHLPAGSFAQGLVTSPPADGPAISLIRYKVHQGLPDILDMLHSIPSHQNVLVHAPDHHNRQAITLLQEKGAAGLHALLPGDQLHF